MQQPQGRQRSSELVVEVGLRQAEIDRDRAMEIAPQPEHRGVILEEGVAENRDRRP